MYNQTRDYGRKGSVIAAISAIDIALWDIAGKYLNKPIYQVTSAYGHFGRSPSNNGEFSWEKTDKKDIFTK